MRVLRNSRRWLGRKPYDEHSLIGFFGHSALGYLVYLTVLFCLYYSECAIK